MRANALLEKRRMKELGHYFKGYLKETILGPLFKLFEASFELLVPIIIARIVDTIIPHHDKNHLYIDDRAVNFLTGKLLGCLWLLRHNNFFFQGCRWLHTSVDKGFI